VESSLMLMNGLTVVVGVYGTLVTLKGVYLLANWLSVRRTEARATMIRPALAAVPRQRIA
jgi:hypothetical protein